MLFIPAGEHQQNLVERAHRTLRGVIRALCLTKDAVTWKAVVREATHQYNSTTHQSTGFTPNLLHLGYEEASPGLLHPEGIPANPPPVAVADRMKLTNQMRELKDLIRGIIIKNQDEACRRAAKYYFKFTRNRVKLGAQLSHFTQTDGDCSPCRKLLHTTQPETCHHVFFSCNFYKNLHIQMLQLFFGEYPFTNDPTCLLKGCFTDIDNRLNFIICLASLCILYTFYTHSLRKKICSLNACKMAVGNIIKKRLMER